MTPIGRALLFLVACGLAGFLLGTIAFRSLNEKGAAPDSSAAPIPLMGRR